LFRSRFLPQRLGLWHCSRCCRTGCLLSLGCRRQYFRSGYRRRWRPSAGMESPRTSSHRVPQRWLDLRRDGISRPRADREQPARRRRTIPGTARRTAAKGIAMTMPKYESNIDVEKISALDMHVHIEMDEQGHKPMPEVFYEASAKYFKSEDRTPSIDRIADTYRDLGMAAVVFTVDARSQFKGHPPNSIDDLVAGAARNNDVLLPFGSVDPRLGEAAIKEAQRQA